jgi:hypothetical protein
VEQEVEDATEDIDLQSPMSTNSRKRASTTCSSPGKKKSPTLRYMKEYMAGMAKNQAERNEYFKQAYGEKQQRKATLGEKLRKVQQLVEECGVSETDPEWFAVHKVCSDENSMQIFIKM